jgi:tetratricopeptide (TPR) repeat protein
MAPEQAGGNPTQVGPAADLHALGVILYELLTGRPPFHGENVLDTLEQVRTQEPIPPGRLRARLPRDLETICLKCLQKEPQKRYADAAALAEDLRRYLAGEAIAARPVGRWERGRRWVRRRPVVAALLLAGSTAVLGLLLEGFLYNLRLTAALHAEAEQRGRAEANAQKARRAVDDMYTQVAEKWLAQQPRLEPLQEEFLQKALAIYEDLLREHSSDPAARQEAATALLRVGSIQRHLGRRQEAEEAYREAVRRYRELVAEFPTEADYGEHLANTLGELARLLHESSRFPEAEVALRQAAAVHEGLSANFPLEPRWRRLGARIQGDLGSVLMTVTGRLQEAEQAHRRALALDEALLAESPDKPAAQHVVAVHSLNLGTVLVETGRAQEAEKFIGRALALLEKLAADYPGDPKYRFLLAVHLQNLAYFYDATGRAAPAEKALGRAIHHQGELARDFPRLVVYRRQLVKYHNDLGALLDKSGRLQEAEAAIRQAVAVADKLLAEFPRVPDYQFALGVTLANLADLLRRRDEFGQAIPLLERAIACHEEALRAAPTHLHGRRWLRHAYATLSDVYLRKGEHAAAARTAEELHRLYPDEPAEYRATAWFLTGCMRLAEKDSALSTEKRQAVVRAYGDRAVEMLRQAVQKGFNDLNHLQTDGNLDPLRGRKDFQQLLSEMASRVKTAGK